METPDFRTIGIADVDRAVRDWFDKTVDVRVETPTTESYKVPVQFSQGERWSIGRTKQSFRDENGVLILPIIALRRTAIDPNPERLALGTQTPNIQIAKRVDPKSNDIKNLEELKTAEIKRRYPAIYDVYTIPWPQRVIITYQLIVQAQYVIQMNEILQKMWRMLDIQRQFVAPLDNDGRVPKAAMQFGAGNPYDKMEPLSHLYVVGFLEDAAADGSNFEEFTDGERIVKYSTEIRVPAALQTAPEGTESPVRVERTAFKLVVKNETVKFVDDPELLEEIFGPSR